MGNYLEQKVAVGVGCPRSGLGRRFAAAVNAQAIEAEFASEAKQIGAESAVFAGG
ncbi:MAG: hypothetical protein Pg6A_02070 [Termitinemataceae bacterium]|nr:MAG: hypothetical protein Pg6A_02070 [Termitinemataceae bacterium]